jgi:hypothetical protein
MALVQAEAGAHITDDEAEVQVARVSREAVPGSSRSALLGLRDRPTAIFAVT